MKVYICSAGWIASSVFVCFMSLFKGVLLSQPQRVRLCNGKHAHKLCAAVWIISIVAGYLGHLYVQNCVNFDFSTCNEIYLSCSNKDQGKLNCLCGIKGIILLLVVMIIFIITMAALLSIQLFKARKVTKQSGKQARWQGIVTVVLTVACHGFSYLILFIRETAGPSVKQTYGIRNYAYFARATYTLFYVNVVGNIFIYSFTVPSFRQFLVTGIRRLSAELLPSNGGINN